MACSSAESTLPNTADSAQFKGAAAKGAVVLTTERLVLRPLEVADLERLVSLANNLSVSRNLSRLPYPYTIADAQHWLSLQDQGRLSDGGLAFAVTLGGGFIGGIGLGPLHSVQHELGYWLGEPYWGRGFASEASRAVIDYGFEMLGLGVIAAGHFADNHASGRVLTKLGFRYTVETMRPSLARGHPARCLEMALSRARWAELRFAKG